MAAEDPRADAVLLVEDDEPLAQVVARHLRARGYSVEVATTVEEADRALANGLQPSVVLLDINLPDDTGWAFLRGGRLAAAGSPPVYVVSATAVSSARLHEFGVAGYLPKPFAMPTLMEIVQRQGRTDGPQPVPADGGEGPDAR
jgi:DNA-binding response OmpR family regulator